VALKINRHLNFVVPIYGEEIAKFGSDGKPETKNGKPVMTRTVIAWVHSVPLAGEVLEKYEIILAQTYSGCFGLGLGVTAGPAKAMRILKNIAMASNAWDGDDGVDKGLVEEIRRLTNVIVPTEKGWHAIPLEVAVAQKKLDSEDKAEVENAVLFFIATSATLPREPRKQMLEAMADLWDARLSPLNATAFASSLGTSTATASSGEPASASAAHKPDPANAPAEGRPALLPH